LEFLIARISEHRNRIDSREEFMQQLHTLRSSNTKISGRTSEVTAWLVETFDKAHLDWVGADLELEDRWGSF
jgi:hypothetical protein